MAKWFVNRNGRQAGPFESAQLKKLAADGKIKPSDQIRREDQEAWHKAEAVKGLFGTKRLEEKKPHEAETPSDQGSDKPANDAVVSDQSVSLKQTLQSGATSLWSATKRNGQIAAKQAEIAKITQLSLPAAYHALGEAYYNKHMGDANIEEPLVAEVTAFRSETKLEKERVGKLPSSTVTEKAKFVAAQAAILAKEKIAEQKIYKCMRLLGESVYARSTDESAFVAQREQVKLLLQRKEKITEDLDGIGREGKVNTKEQRYKKATFTQTTERKSRRISLRPIVVFAIGIPSLLYLGLIFLVPNSLTDSEETNNAQINRQGNDTSKKQNGVIGSSSSSTNKNEKVDGTGFFEGLSLANSLESVRDPKVRHIKNPLLKVDTPGKREGHDGQSDYLAMSFDGKYVLLFQWPAWRLFHVPEKSWIVLPQKVVWAEMSPDGRRLACVLNDANTVKSSETVLVVSDLTTSSLEERYRVPLGLRFFDDFASINSDWSANGKYILIHGIEDGQLGLIGTKWTKCIDLENKIISTLRVPFFYGTTKDGRHGAVSFDLLKTHVYADDWASDTGNDSEAWFNRQRKILNGGGAKTWDLFSNQMRFFCDDGKSVFIGFNEGGIRFDVQTGKIIEMLSRKEQSMYPFNPADRIGEFICESKYDLKENSHRFELRNYKTRNSVLSLEGHVTDVVFSQDHKSVRLGEAGKPTRAIFAVPEGKKTGEEPYFASKVSYPVRSLDSHRKRRKWQAVQFDRGPVEVWDDQGNAPAAVLDIAAAENNDQLYKLSKSKRRIAAISDDGEFVVTAWFWYGRGTGRGIDEIEIWSTKGGEVTSLSKLRSEHLELEAKPLYQYFSLTKTEEEEGWFLPQTSYGLAPRVSNQSFAKLMKYFGGDSLQSFGDGFVASHRSIEHRRCSPASVEEIIGGKAHKLLRSYGGRDIDGITDTWNDIDVYAGEQENSFLVLRYRRDRHFFESTLVEIYHQGFVEPKH